MGKPGTRFEREVAKTVEDARRANRRLRGSRAGVLAPLSVVPLAGRSKAMEFPIGCRALSHCVRKPLKPYLWLILLRLSAFISVR